MLFQPRKKKHVEVPIVPLLDILAILLIYFIVTTEKKQKRDYLEVDIPTAHHLNTSEEVASNVQLVISADGRITLDGGILPEGTLVDSLKSYLEINPEKGLEIKADKDVTVQQQVYILEALQKAGVKKAPWLIKKDKQQ